MPKPVTKEKLITASVEERQALLAELSQIKPEEMIKPGAVGEWSIKDVLAHLHEWQQMLLGWLDAGRQGETPAVPAEGYNWGQVPALNDSIFHHYKDNDLEHIQSLFEASYDETMEVIESLSEDVLFQRALYPWMNNNHLAAYFIANTSSHDRWARKEIRKAMRAKLKQDQDT
jgi:hypothetical protein